MPKTPNARKDDGGGRFRLLAGDHSQKDADGVARTYEKGEVIHSPVDLAGMFGLNKFQRLDPAPGQRATAENATQGGGPLPRDQKETMPSHQEELHRHPEAKKPPNDDTAEDDGFDQMTVAELKAHAAAEELDLGGATHKADIVAAIRAATVH